MYPTSPPYLNPAHTFLKVVDSPFMPSVLFSFHQELKSDQNGNKNLNLTDTE